MRDMRAMAIAILSLVFIVSVPAYMVEENDLSALVEQQIRLNKDKQESKKEAAKQKAKKRQDEADSRLIQRLERQEKHRRKQFEDAKNIKLQKKERQEKLRKEGLSKKGVIAGPGREAKPKQEGRSNLKDRKKIADEIKKHEEKARLKRSLDKQFIRQQLEQRAQLEAGLKEDGRKKEVKAAPLSALSKEFSQQNKLAGEKRKEFEQFIKKRLLEEQKWTLQRQKQEEAFRKNKISQEKLVMARSANEEKLRQQLLGREKIQKTPKPRAVRKTKAQKARLSESKKETRGLLVKQRLSAAEERQKEEVLLSQQKARDAQDKQQEAVLMEQAKQGRISVEMIDLEPGDDIARVEVERITKKQLAAVKPMASSVIASEPGSGVRSAPSVIAGNLKQITRPRRTNDMMAMAGGRTNAPEFDEAQDIKRERAQALFERRQKIEERNKEKEQQRVLKSALRTASEKERADEAKKIKKIEELWNEARALYQHGSYDEAIKRFNLVVELEGNPRIKYTPLAREFIEKAKEKIDEKKDTRLSKEMETSEKEMIREVIKNQIPPYVEPPRKIESASPIPLIEMPAIVKKLKNAITLDFAAVALKSCLDFIAQETGVSLVASSKVIEQNYKVTANFKEVSAADVLKYIIKSLNLQYRIDKEVVWIALPEEMANEPFETRVYYLNKGGGLFTEFSAIGGGSTETSLGSSSATITKVTTLEDTLKEAVEWPSGSKIFYDKRINALIAHNTPQNLQMLEEMLYNLDVTPFQILIEAKFLEIDITDTEELGLDWKFNSDLPLNKNRKGDALHSIGKDFGIDFSSFTRATEGFNLTYKGVLTEPQFEVVLHALQENKKVKTLSSPRITTLNNQLATIKVVDEWIYPTRYEFQIVQFDKNGDGDFDDAGETRYENVPMDFIRRDVGILLKVIPSVGADKKTINLSLIPEVSSATKDFFTYTGDVKLPQFTSRNLSTTIVVNSSDTVVLGGLIKESRTKIKDKVPLLGDIPLVGALFTKNTDSLERKNLLIFVTAKLISPTGEELFVQ